MKDLYRRNSLTPYEEDTSVLERHLSGFSKDAEAGREILLHPRCKRLYDRYHADLALLGRLRGALDLANAPFCREDELGDFHVVADPVSRRSPLSEGAEASGSRHGRHRTRRGSGAGRWSRRVAVVAGLALLVALQMGVELPWFPGGEPGAGEPASASDSRRRFAVTDAVNVYDRPDAGAVVVDQLRRFDIVRIDPRPEGWARVLNREFEGYVETRLLAAEDRCRTYGVVRPGNGAVLDSDQHGGYALTIRNNTDHDAIIKASNRLGDAVVRFYARARHTVTYGNLPIGEYEIKYAVGEDFSPYCGAFLVDMRAHAASRPLQLPGAGGDNENTYTIQGGIGSNSFASRRIDLDDF